MTPHQLAHQQLQRESSRRLDRIRALEGQRDRAKEQAKAESTEKRRLQKENRVLNDRLIEAHSQMEEYSRDLNRETDLRAELEQRIGELIAKVQRREVAA